MTTDPEAKILRNDWKAIARYAPQSESCREKLPLNAIATGDRVLFHLLHPSTKPTKKSP